MMRSAILGIVGLVIGSLGVSAQGQDKIPAPDLQAIQKATVLIEVLLPNKATPQQHIEQAWRGTGLVVRVDGDKVTVVTADRVIEEHRKEVFVIFEAGTKNERRVAAGSVVAREDFGIMLVQVPGVKTPPRPLAVASIAPMIARSKTNRPVLLYGYPKTTPPYPAIKVLTGSAPTEGDDALAEILPLEVPGDWNTGFGGGLVVDETGKALGIATMSERLGKIDEYIPLPALVRGLEPQLTHLTFEAKSDPEPRVETKGVADIPTKVNFRAHLDDPLASVLGLSLTVLAKSAVPGGPRPLADGSWGAALVGVKSTPLTVTKEGDVTGTFEIFPASDSEATFWVQTILISEGKGFVFAKPVAYRVGTGIIPDPIEPEAVAVRTTVKAGDSRPKIAAAPPAEPAQPAGGFARVVPSRMPDRTPVTPPHSSARKNKADEEPKGGFADLKDSNQGGKTREPTATNATLAGDPRSVDGLEVTEIDVPAAGVLPCMVWSADTKVLFVAEKTGVVRRIKADGFVEEVQVDLKAACSWLALSAEGLLVAIEATGEVWVLDPATLKFKFKFKVSVPSVDHVVASPVSSLAYAIGGKRNDAVLSVIDLKRKKIARQYGPRDIAGGDDGFKHLAITPDGKYLFCQGGIEQLHRFRVKGTEIEHQEASERIAQNGKSIVISPDGYYVALPSGGGNYNTKGYGTYIYKITNLAKPAITITSGSYPETLGFDLKGGLIYAQNHDFPLLVFLPTGVKQKESKLGVRGNDSTRQFLVHPDGRQVLVLTSHHLALVRVPKDNE